MTPRFSVVFLLIWSALGGAGCTKLLRSDEATFASRDGAAQSVDLSSRSVECDFVGDPLYLKPAEPRTSAWFGSALAANNNRLVASAPLELASSTPVRESLDPAAHCIDRGPLDMDVIGAGRIRVYERAENAWSEQRLDLSDAASIHPMVPKDALQGSLKIGNFPTYSVAASDDWIAIGTAGDSVRGPFRGSVRVLGRSGSDGVWSEQAYRVQAPNTGDNDLFGGAVALSGNVLVVGAPSEDSSGVVDSGAAYVYELTASGFSLVRRLKSALPSRLGWYGVTVAISNDWVAVGAPAEQGLVNAQTGPYGGAVHVYRRTAPNQVESEEDLLVAPGPELAGFGMSIALAGDRLAVGAPGADCPGRATPNNAGAVYLYSNASGKWGHPECLDSGDNHSSLFGWSVALNADALAVGAPWSSGPWRGFEPEVMDKPYPGGGLYEASGSVYVFRSRDGVLQNRACAVKPPNTGACDAFGNWVALADDYLAVGAPFEDGQAGGIGPPDEGNGLMDSGAAYIYALRSGAP